MIGWWWHLNANFWLWRIFITVCLRWLHFINLLYSVFKLSAHSSFRLPADKRLISCQFVYTVSVARCALRFPTAADLKDDKSAGLTSDKQSRCGVVTKCPKKNCWAKSSTKRPRDESQTKMQTMTYKIHIVQLFYFHLKCSGVLKTDAQYIRLLASF